MVREQFGAPLLTSNCANFSRGEGCPSEVNDIAYLSKTVEATPQVVTPETLQKRFLHFSHYPKLSEQSEGRHLFVTLRRDIYWPAMAVDRKATVRFCTECSNKLVKLWKIYKKLKLFPPGRGSSLSPLTFSDRFPVHRARIRSYMLLRVDSRSLSGQCLSRELPPTHLQTRSLRIAYFLLTSRGATFRQWVAICISVFPGRLLDTGCEEPLHEYL